MKITIEIDNEDWVVRELVFHREDGESVERFKVAIQNALLHSGLAEQHRADMVIDEHVKKYGEDKLGYWSLGGDPGWVASFGQIPWMYVFDLFGVNWREHIDTEGKEQLCMKK